MSVKSNVKSYTDSQILERVEFVGGNIHNEGSKYLLVGVQSNEDQFNVFDDKFYIYDGNKFKMVTTGTTNAGKTALKMFDRYNLEGAAVWKTNEFYSNLYQKGYHKVARKGGGMRALRQVAPIKYYRDKNKNSKAEQIGELYSGVIYANMHGVDYDPFSNITKQFINGWSFACQVMNVMSDYRHWQRAAWKRNRLIDYALLEEW